MLYDMKQRKGVLIALNSEEIEEIKSAVKKIVEKKQQEYKVDNEGLYNRFLPGFLAEKCVSKYLSTSGPDLSVGEAKNYHKADIKELNIGVKCVKEGRRHIIHKNNTTDQILVNQISESEFIILGLATKEILNKYQDDNGIYGGLKDKGTKTQFTGYEFLKNIKDYVYLSNNK